MKKTWEEEKQKLQSYNDNPVDTVIHVDNVDEKVTASSDETVEPINEAIENALNPIGSAFDQINVAPIDQIVDPIIGTTSIEEENVDKLIVKLFFETNIYRFSISSNCSYEALRSIINEKMKAGYETCDGLFNVTYIDEEQDKITLASQEEWEEALRVLEGAPVIKLYVCKN